MRNPVQPDLTDLEREIVAWLHVQARGRHRAVSIDTLRFVEDGALTAISLIPRHSRRDVEAALQGLRNAGRPVGTCDRGVFIIVDRKDAALAIRYLRGRIWTQLRGLRRLRRTVQDTLSKQRFVEVGKNS
jgi:hypothetical protein